MSPTREVEKFVVPLNLAESKRYFQTIANKLSDPDNDFEKYILTGADGQRLQVLLDALE